MAYHKPVDWNEQMDAVIIKACEEHATFTAVAEELGVSRNSVLKRATQLGRVRDSNFWTEDQRDILKAEWAKGTTCSQIGALLGKTKNSVIGQAHRMKLERRAPYNASAPRKPRPPKANKPLLPKKSGGQIMVTINKKAAPPKFFAAAVPLTSKPPISIMGLNATTCRAIVGTGPDGLAVYCGDFTFQNKAFCEGHCAMYFQPPQERRRG